jgi:hypothetical protein
MATRGRLVTALMLLTAFTLPDLARSQETASEALEKIRQDLAAKEARVQAETAKLKRAEGRG